MNSVKWENILVKTHTTYKCAYLHFYYLIQCMRKVNKIREGRQLKIIFQNFLKSNNKEDSHLHSVQEWSERFKMKWRRFAEIRSVLKLRIVVSKLVENFQAGLPTDKEEFYLKVEHTETLLIIPKDSLLCLFLSH